MARKATPTAEAVIRYFVSATSVDAMNTFVTVKTILEAKGVLTSRKRTKKFITDSVGTSRTVTN